MLDPILEMAAGTGSCAGVLMSGGTLGVSGLLSRTPQEGSSRPVLSALLESLLSFHSYIYLFLEDSFI